MPVVFVLIVAIVAGLVAAAGDRMGYRAARRKLRIGKLRPRTVAMLIAVSTGIVISLATYGVVLLIWKDFRDALTKYQSTKAALATAQAELEPVTRARDAAVREKDIAEADKEKAVAANLAAQTELAEANKQLSDIRGQLMDSTIKLDQAKQQVSSLDRQAKSLNNRIAQLQKEKKDLEGYQAVEGDLRDVLEQAREDFEEGDIVLARGTVLRYERVSSGEQGDISTVMNRLLNRTLVSLQRGGLKLAESVPDSAQQFASSYPFSGSSEDSVIIVRAAKNIIKGQDVELEFEARALPPLVANGAEVMKIEISADRATISTSGGGSEVLSVPASFDNANVVNFIGEIKRIFSENMSREGFLPIPRSGGYPIPSEDINSISNALIGSSRPLTIRLLATEAYDALEGIPSVQVQVNGAAQ